MRHLVAADTGGTFTDVAVYDPASGSLGFGKTLTTYADLVDGVLTGLGETGAAPDGIALLRHGTTHVINAFLQRRGARSPKRLACTTCLSPRRLPGCWTSTCT